MYKKAIILFVILSSLSLFDLIIFPDIMIKALEFATPLLMLFLILFYAVYDKSFRFKKKFNMEMIFVVIALVLSMIGAYFFHHQNYSITILTQRYMYFFLIYPLLHSLKPKPDELIKMIIYFGIAYAILYLIQFLVYPMQIFKGRISVDRGTLRIFLPGSGYLFLAYLIGLSRFIRTYSRKYMALCFLAIIIFVLLGTRQVIAAAGFVTILSILFSKKVKSRALTIFLIVLGIIPTYFLFQNIFMAMFEVSQKQVGSYQENVRIKAATFFLYDFFPNKLSYITGNGVPSANSPYGMHVIAYEKLFGFFLSDVGIIGDYTKFGIFIVIAQLSMFIRMLIIRIPFELDFLKYNIIAVLMTIIVGSAFGSADYIVLLCISCYLIDVSVQLNKKSDHSVVGASEKT